MKKGHLFKTIVMRLIAFLIVLWGGYLSFVLLQPKIQTNTPEQWNLTREQYDALQNEMLGDADKMNGYYTLTKQDSKKAKQWRDIADRINNQEY